MKALRKTLTVSVVLTLLMAISSLSVNAQERANRDSLGNIVRGPYETNRAWDNWYVGVGGGANFILDDWTGKGSTYNSRIAPSVDVYVGKWFTPTIGARVGYSGFRTNAWNKNLNAYTDPSSYSDSKEKYKEKVRMSYFYGDLMWNFSNAVSGYREDRFWDFIPYFSAGVYHSNGVDGVGGKGNEFALGIGLYNTMRISKRVDIVLDARELLFRGDVHGTDGGIAALTSINVGISVNLGKTGFRRSPSTYRGSEAAAAAAKAAAAAALEEENEKLRADNANLEEKVADLEENVADLEDKLAGSVDDLEALTVCPGAVYFSIGQTTLTPDERSHLDFYVKNVIMRDPDATFVLTGYADKDTGGKQRNQYLSQKRVDTVVDILKNDYDISEDRLVVKAVGAESTFNEEYAELNRCVVIDYAE